MAEQDLQIVVASDQLRLVDQEIGRWLGGRRDPEPQLGLRLVTFTDEDAVTAAANDLAERHIAEFPDAKVPEIRTELDRVLAELRLLYENRYAGWAPTMGKNRTLNGVQFKPYTHSYDAPRSIERPEDVAFLGLVPATERRVQVGLFDTRLDAKEELTGTYLADDEALLENSDDTRLWWEGHATFIAGIIRRIAPSTILDVRTALRRGPVGVGRPRSEEWTMTLWDFAGRLAEYADSGIEVLNLSLGLTTEDGKPPLVLERAIARLTADIVVVAAAGNHGSGEVTDEERLKIGMPLLRNAPLYPAALDNVLAVGALGPDGQPAAFNPRGRHEYEYAPWIDVWAPGVNLASLYLGSEADHEVVRVEDRNGDGEDVPFTGWADWSGTSFAAGIVTAEVANYLAAGASADDAVARVRADFPRPEVGGADAQ